jgi:hypothetical protein
MTRFEAMEARVAGLSARVLKVERALEGRLAADGDELAAQQQAEALGFGAEVLVLAASCQGASNRGKRAVARRLADKGWSAARIARVLRVCERTVERWSQGGGVPTAERESVAREKGRR